MAPTATLDASDITEKARRDLLQLLEGVRGKKNLVIEKSLAGPVGLFVKFSTLQEYGVDKVFFLENNNVDSTQRNVVFLARGEKARQVQAIAEQIKRVRRESKQDHEFSIFWVPRRTLVSDQILEETGVLGEVNVVEFPMYFVPLEKTVLSLEMDDAFGDIYLRRDPTAIFLAARALMLLQKSQGLFPRILGKGENAKSLANMLLHMRAEEDIDASSDPSNAHVHSFDLTPSATIDNLIIIDRGVDFPTVLLTQLTYEGLIDETFGIQNNQTEVDSSITGAAPSQPPPQQTSGANSQAPAVQPPASSALKRKILLDSTDKLYTQLRDANFAIVGTLLSRVARRLQSDYDSRHKANQSINELREFVNKLPSYQAEQASLKIHISLADELKKVTNGDLFLRVLEVQQNLAAGADPSTVHEIIEELIARDCPLTTVLRLLCLESSVSGGLRQRDLEHFKRQVLQGYGYQHLLTFAALEKIGLLIPRVSAGAGAYLNPLANPSGAATVTDYNLVRKSLKLFVDDVNESEPNDIAYVFSGYAPLSVRLVQCILQKPYLAQLTNPRTTPALNSQPSTATASGNWKGFEDVLARIKGPTVDEVQKGHNAAASQARKTLQGSGGGQVKTSIVFFLGGVTFAEIAALRYINGQLGEKRRLIVATTGMIKGDTAVGAGVEGRSFKTR
ncbi:Vacuolar protein-sorting-associated protein 33 [Elasticomyces elasticus]|nr:Vacuolar protein-sorting-associated protein 33 [Elasticomyces elasticus]KAK4996705.1 Vacuolar protein-sorting-associated protein 33 [Elasticomyces elasticus]